MKLIKADYVQGMYLAISLDIDAALKMVDKAAMNKGQKSKSGAILVEIKGYPELKGVKPSYELREKIRAMLSRI